VNEQVDHRCGGNVVAEDLAPGREELIPGDDQAGAFVAARDDMNIRFAKTAPLLEDRFHARDAADHAIGMAT